MKQGGATPPMSTPASRARPSGLTILLISVSVGINIGGFGLLLCFAGILAGVSLVAVGVRMADDPVVPAVFDGARALAASLLRHLNVVGLAMASCAVAAVSTGEGDQLLCFAFYALLLLGLSLINIGVTRDS